MSIFSLKKIADICKNYKEQNNLNQTEMGKLLGINEQTYGKIEREQYFPKIEQIDMILSLTNSTLDQVKSSDTSHSVLAALKGKAQTDTEKIVFDTLVNAILCLDKHKNIKSGNYANE